MNASLDSTGQLASSPSGRRVAIITGGSQGIGTGLVSGFRRAGYAVVATSRSIGGADEDNYLTVRGDIAEAQTARNVVEVFPPNTSKDDTPAAPYEMLS
jgi:NAD(P)-dependent dehydrogenase (short-subunit alcohol dehydrogenase family)